MKANVYMGFLARTPQSLPKRTTKTIVGNKIFMMWREYCFPLTTLSFFYFINNLLFEKVGGTGGTVNRDRHLWQILGGTKCGTEGGTTWN